MHRDTDAASFTIQAARKSNLNNISDSVGGATEITPPPGRRIENKSLVDGRR